MPYFHVVFTLPHALGALVRANRRRLYGLLFRSAAATLRTFALDPRPLGAEPAITMVLHTWGQTLEQHVHVHCVVSGGGFSPDRRSWVSLPRSRKGRRRPFLFPVKALSKVSRGKLIAALERAHRRGQLRTLDQSTTLGEPGPWRSLVTTHRGRDWVVHAKPPFGGPAQVLEYLSRYTHRVVISNRRLLSLEGGIVRFAYRDYADHQRRKVMALPATEFLRRFLQRVVPKGFMRIRHYGITANCRRREKPRRSRQLLGAEQPEIAAHSDAVPGEPSHESLPSLESHTARCPSYGGRMCVIELLPPTRAPRDTS